MTIPTRRLRSIAIGACAIGAVYAVALTAIGSLRAEPSMTAASLPYLLRTRDLTPEWLDSATAGAGSMHRVGRFTLRDQHGAAVTDSALDGRLTIVHFFFAECGGVCPMTQTNLARVLAALDSVPGVVVLSHSVQPERDTVAALAAYAHRHGIVDPRWHLLTGAREEIERLAAESYFVNLRDGRSYGTANLAHTETVVLIDGSRRIRGVYDGTIRLDMDRLVDDIRTYRRGA